MSHLQLYRAILSQLLNSRATPLPITAANYSVQLFRENAVNADWSILVYATKLQCSTRHVTLAILSRNKVARPNRAIKLQLWHQSYDSALQKFLLSLSVTVRNTQCGCKFLTVQKTKYTPICTQKRVGVERADCPDHIFAVHPVPAVCRSL